MCIDKVIKRVLCRFAPGMSLCSQGEKRMRARACLLRISSVTHSAVLILHFQTQRCIVVFRLTLQEWVTMCHARLQVCCWLGKIDIGRPSAAFLQVILPAKNRHSLARSLRISLRHSGPRGLSVRPSVRPPLSRVSISGCSVGTIANERDEKER